jgi:hypothetical protein
MPVKTGLGLAVMKDLGAETSARRPPESPKPLCFDMTEATMTTTFPADVNLACRRCGAADLIFQPGERSGIWLTFCGLCGDLVGEAADVSADVEGSPQWQPDRNQSDACVQSR